MAPRDSRYDVHRQVSSQSRRKTVSGADVVGGDGIRVWRGVWEVEVVLACTAEYTRSACAAAWWIALDDASSSITDRSWFCADAAAVAVAVWHARAVGLASFAVAECVEVTDVGVSGRSMVDEVDDAYKCVDDR